MTLLYWGVVGLFVIDIVGKIIMLGTGKWPERTAAGLAKDLICNGAMLIWIIAAWR